MTEEKRKYKIKDLPKVDRPREKLIKYGQKNFLIPNF